MRITEQEKAAIIKVMKQVFGDDTNVILFGSRADITQKGGDIDLYIKLNYQLEPDIKLNKKIAAISKLICFIGDQKIDLIINDGSDHQLIYSVAERDGMKLC